MGTSGAAAEMFGEDVRDDSDVVAVTASAMALRPNSVPEPKGKLCCLQSGWCNVMNGPISTTVEPGGSCEARCDSSCETRKCEWKAMMHVML